MDLKLRELHRKAVMGCERSAEALRRAKCFRFKELSPCIDFVFESTDQDPWIRVKINAALGSFDTFTRPNPMVYRELWDEAPHPTDLSGRPACSSSYLWHWEYLSRINGKFSGRPQFTLRW